MLSKALLVLLSVTSLMVFGCATGRNYQSDIDALNARVSTLQGQLSAKDEEISRLQGQVREEQQAKSQAASERGLIAEKLNAALAKLEDRKRQEEAKAAESDLK